MYAAFVPRSYGCSSFSLTQIISIRRFSTTVLCTTPTLTVLVPIIYIRVPLQVSVSLLFSHKTSTTDDNDHCLTDLNDSTTQFKSMSRPVITNTWAGNFDCSICRRKRLMANEFSKKALERYRKQRIPLKCKTCVLAAEAEERDNAKSRKHTGGVDADESRRCLKCSKVLSRNEFNKNQWNKGEGKSRCRTCVEEALREEATHQSISKEAKILEARLKVEEAKKNGKSTQILLAAESHLAALEANIVTGLKPVKMSAGRGRKGRITKR